MPSSIINADINKITLQKMAKSDWGIRNLSYGNGLRWKEQNRRENCYIKLLYQTRKISVNFYYEVIR